MGLFRLGSNIGIAVFGYLYPSYATYKLLAARSPTNPETAALDSWIHYWCTIAILVGFEETFEWFFNWFPLYYEAKFIFILWLVSPATQGATYVYNTYLQPFYASNTQNIDHAIASARTNSIGFLQSSFAAIWQFVITKVTTAQAEANQNAGPAPGQAGNPAQNNMSQAMAGLWSQYGPAVLSAGASILSPARNKNAAQQAVSSQSFPDPNQQLPPRSVPPPSANMPSPAPTPGADALRYRSPAADSTGGRSTPPPAFPTPQI